MVSENLQGEGQILKHIKEGYWLLFVAVLAHKNTLV